MIWNSDDLEKEVFTLPIGDRYIKYSKTEGKYCCLRFNDGNLRIFNILTKDLWPFYLGAFTDDFNFDDLLLIYKNFVIVTEDDNTIRMIDLKNPIKDIFSPKFKGYIYKIDMLDGKLIVYTLSKLEVFDFGKFIE